MNSTGTTKASGEYTKFRILCNCLGDFIALVCCRCSCSLTRLSIPLSAQDQGSNRAIRPASSASPLQRTDDPAQRSRVRGRHLRSPGRARLALRRGRRHLLRPCPRLVPGRCCGLGAGHAAHGLGGPRQEPRSRRRDRAAGPRAQAARRLRHPGRTAPRRRARGPAPAAVSGAIQARAGDEPGPAWTFAPSSTPAATTTTTRSSGWWRWS